MQPEDASHVPPVDRVVGRSSHPLCCTGAVLRLIRPGRALRTICSRACVRVMSRGGRAGCSEARWKRPKWHRWSSGGRIAALSADASDWKTWQPADSPGSLLQSAPCHRPHPNHPALATPAAPQAMSGPHVSTPPPPPDTAIRMLGHHRRVLRWGVARGDNGWPSDWRQISGRIAARNGCAS